MADPLPPAHPPIIAKAPPRRKPQHSHKTRTQTRFGPKKLAKVFLQGVEKPAT